MGHDGLHDGPTDGAARVAVPAGWVPVDLSGGPIDATTQVITVEAWDPSWGLRPTMTVTTSPPGEHHVALRVLEEAQANLPGLLVVSIDPWNVPGSETPGRRLVFAHAEGDVTLTTLVWVVDTAAGDVVVSARSESLGLHLHDRAFAEAVAGIRLPAEPASAGAPATGDLARRTATTPWTDVVPPSGGLRASFVADPEARILVEASAAGTDLTFDATLAGGEATVAATASPRTPAPGVSDPEAGPTTFRIPVSQLALAVARWLGLSPARSAAGAAVTVPISTVMHRLVDPSIAPPPGVDASTWRQPWFLWTLRSSATDAGLVMVDAGASGQCAVMETDDARATRFAPLSTYNVWLTLNWVISESLAV
jgi:hypothetical protein